MQIAVCLLLFWGGKEALLHTFTLLVVNAYGFLPHVLASFTLGILEGLVAILAGICILRQRLRLAARCLMVASPLKIASAVVSILQEKQFAFPIFATGVGYGVVLFLVGYWLSRQKDTQN